MVKVKKMRKKDVLEMVNFSKHTDVRLLHYNFEYKTKKECKLWYRVKTKFLRRYIFSIYDYDVFVGYITLKNINWIIKKAEMGVVINPLYTAKGIGTEAIKKYLKIVFTKYKMKSIYLKVASFNLRAKKCYEKVGFQEYKKVYEKYEDQDYLLKNDEYKKFDEIGYEKGIIYNGFECSVGNGC